MSDATANQVDDVEPDESSQIPEGLELHKNGTVTVVLDNDRIVLRRPKMGEFRKLRELLHANQDTLYEMADEAGLLRASIVTEGEEATSPENAARLQRARRMEREMTRRTEDLNLGWMRETLALLGGGTVPADDDLPLWMADGSAITTLIGHWRSVPLARGVR